MAEESSRPEVRLAALKRERAAIESKPYRGEEGAATKERRLSEIDDAIRELDGNAAPSSGRQKAVRG